LRQREIDHPGLVEGEALRVERVELFAECAAQRRFVSAFGGDLGLGPNLMPPLAVRAMRRAARPRRRVSDV
jgi:hypothetical protein